MTTVKTPWFRSIVRTIVAGLIALVAIALTITVHTCIAINDEIDRCADDSSSEYIIDPAQRAKECADRR
ncbi:hypothetical protein [Hansschlegelia plantiphila]|uniref:Uncharacterized protein n=1 Tax=Hansschlegelia plantiphila TaxID=374655 RepID=A0A9W6MU08_9HYPH|nr:hypothetical protein [Hansschlegelia plantiphila]GLK66388.1 hypothetical protein GCM10008179_00260 [Hansschlegelia plantiphila]